MVQSFMEILMYNYIHPLCCFYHLSGENSFDVSLREAVTIRSFEHQQPFVLPW